MKLHVLTSRTLKDVCLILSFTTIIITTLIGQDLSIVSWNLKDFGQSRDDNEIAMIAEQIRDADIVAIQEVVAKHPGGVQAVARLVDQLNRMGAKWDYRTSDPTRSSSPYKSERYAFLWKTSKVSLLGGRPSLVSELATYVEREPYVARFNYQGEELVIVNYHACTHTNDYPERAEIQAITKWVATTTYTDIIWAGDMNLVIDDYAFDACKKDGFKSVLHGEKTSLKKTCVNGNYGSRAEDNVLYRLSELKMTGYSVVDFIKDGDCNDVSWKRTSYSDHMGVEIRVGR